MFQILSTVQVIELLRTFKFTRKITQWHIHHTWKPNYASFNGKNHIALQESMKKYHVDTNGWSDIGQHFTLYPDGKWATGRGLNRNPASILGWNTGAIAVEMVGNFDKGYDVMTKAQQDAIYEVTEFAVEQMELIPRFHRDHPDAGKTCPGSGIDRDVFFAGFTNFTENKLAEQAAKAKEEADKKALEEARKKAERIKELISKLDIRFSDMLIGESAHWANTYVNFMNDKRIITGIDNHDGTFRYEPDRFVTRAEVAVIGTKLYESIMEQVQQKLDEIVK